MALLRFHPEGSSHARSQQNHYDVRPLGRLGAALRRKAPAERADQREDVVARHFSLPERGVRAKEIIDQIQNQADRGGQHYSPCFRDSLGDARSWAEPILQEALDRAYKAGMDDGFRAGATAIARHVIVV